MSKFFLSPAEALAAVWRLATRSRWRNWAGRLSRGWCSEHAVRGRSSDPRQVSVRPSSSQPHGQLSYESAEDRIEPGVSYGAAQSLWDQGRFGGEVAKATVSPFQYGGQGKAGPVEGTRGEEDDEV